MFNEAKNVSIVVIFFNLNLLCSTSSTLCLLEKNPFESVDVKPSILIFNIHHMTKAQKLIFDHFIITLKLICGERVKKRFPILNSSCSNSLSIT